MSLTITRRPSEMITIGEKITITVARIIGRKVQLRVDAPKEMEIRRVELPTYFSEPPPMGRDE